MTQAEKTAALLEVMDLLILAISQNKDVMRNHYLQQASKLRATIQ